MRSVPTNSAGPRRVVTALSIVGLTLAGAALRLASIDTRSLWLDETTAVRQASWSIAHMLEWMAGNVHPPLFHTLLHYWIVYFGRSEIAVRGFAAVWGVVAIPLVYWVGRSIYDRRVGIVAAALVAITPCFIWYAQEARMYTMMLVFALLAIGALWKALERGGFGWWALFAVASGAGLMTHYFFAFMVVGQVAYVVLVHSPRRVRTHAAVEASRTGWAHPWRLLRAVPELGALAAALLVAALPLVWWLPKVLAHTELLRGATGAFNYGGVPPVVGLHFNQLILVPVEWFLGFHSETVMTDLVAMWPLLITLVFVSAGLVRRASPRTWYVISAGVGGAAAITLLGMWQPIALEARYYTAVAVPLVVLTARAIVELRPSARRALLVVLVVIAAAAWADQSYDPSSVVKWDNREAMALVASGYQAGDTILLLPSFASSIPEYYLPADAYAAVRTVPSYDSKGQPRNTPAKLAQDLDRQVGPSRRVWVVATWQETPRIALDRTLTAEWLAGQGFVNRQDRQFRRIRVTLFEIGQQRGFFIAPGVTQ